MVTTTACTIKMTYQSMITLQVHHPLSASPKSTKEKETHMRRERERDYPLNLYPKKQVQRKEEEREEEREWEGQWRLKGLGWSVSWNKTTYGCLTDKFKGSKPNRVMNCICKYSTLKFTFNKGKRDVSKWEGNCLKCTNGESHPHIGGQ